MTITQPTPQRRTFVRRCGVVLRQVLSWLVVALIAWLLLPTQYGGHLGTTVVSGHSMEPTYWTGDLVLTWSGDDYEAGDAVVYAVPAGEPGEGLHVVHRITDADPEGYTMLGDNNDEVDYWNPTAADVQGRVLLAIPQGGRWMQVLLSPLALALLCGVLVTWAVLTGDDEDSDQDSDDEPDEDDETGAGGGREEDETVGPRIGRQRTPGQRTPTMPGPRVRPASTPAPASASASAQPLRRTVGRQLLAGLGATVALVGLSAGVPSASASSLGGLTSSKVFATSVRAQVDLPQATMTTSRTVTNDNPTNYCATTTVTNEGGQAADWEVTLDMATAPYAAERITSSSNVTSVSFVARKTWTVKGVGWNSKLAAGASTSFQYCAERPELPLTDAAVAITVTSSNQTSYCANVTVSTGSQSWIRWRATIDPSTSGLGALYALDKEPSSFWNANTISFSAAAHSWVVRGTGSTELVKAGQPQTWGYCSDYSSTAPATDASVSVRITSESGNGSNTQFCAEVTVSTTSNQWIRWRATLDHQTPELNATRYRLSSEPSNMWNASSVAFTGGSKWEWTLKGAGHNPLIKAGTPTTFGFCK